VEPPVYRLAFYFCEPNGLHRDLHGLAMFWVDVSINLR
jgi:hypothetical protein